MEGLNTEQSHAYMDLLSAATVACPRIPFGLPCPDCHGTGTIPRFPGVRRGCDCVCHEPITDNTKNYPVNCLTRCWRCKGRDWFPDYDATESAVMAGLTRMQADDVMFKAFGDPQGSELHDPMPSMPEIREAWLLEVCRVAGLLEVADG